MYSKNHHLTCSQLHLERCFLPFFYPSRWAVIITQSSVLFIGGVQFFWRPGIQAWWDCGTMVPLTKVLFLQVVVFYCGCHTDYGESVVFLLQSPWHLCPLKWGSPPVNTVCNFSVFSEILFVIIYKFPYQHKAKNVKTQLHTYRYLFKKDSWNS